MAKIPDVPSIFDHECNTFCRPERGIHAKVLYTVVAPDDPRTVEEITGISLAAAGYELVSIEEPKEYIPLKESRAMVGFAPDENLRFYRDAAASTDAIASLVIWRDPREV